MVRMGYNINKDNMTKFLTKLLLRDTIRNLIMDLGFCSPKDIGKHMDIMNLVIIMFEECWLRYNITKMTISILDTIYHFLLLFIV